MSENVEGPGLVRASLDFIHDLRHKFHRDEAFLLAAAIAWGLSFALIPLLALAIGLAGFVLSARFDDPTSAVVTLFARGFPEGGGGMDFTVLLQTLVGEVMTSRTSVTAVGLVLFVWLATALSESLRTALGRVFEVGTRRGFLAGKAFDVVAVVLGVVLVTLNLGVTILFSSAMDFGVDVFGLGGATLTLAQRAFGFGVAFTSIWTLFVIVYRYLPARRTDWRTTLVAATFAGLAHEGLKLSFSWYLTEVANYTSTLGNLATVAVLFFWIYYGALVFILGGEVAHVYVTKRVHPTELSGAREGV